MADNITFHQYNNLHDIEDSWRSLDQQAERLSLGYIHYTYYQTYEWNEFLYHHTLRGLGALTTAMRYDLVRVGGRPFAILPMAVTRSSKKARIPSCRVGGVLNMVCPYPYEGHEEVMEAIAAHLRSSCQGMTLSLADVPCCSALARIMPTLSPDPASTSPCRSLPPTKPMSPRFQRTSTRTSARPTTTSPPTARPWS